MSYPPPPPDRMHLQYQPVPPQPQQAGPAGAYGPVQQRPDQPIPGQLPPPEMTMRKPGTITGIQVILWIFMALAGLGDIASAISLVEYFTPFGLIGLAWAVYSTVQALVSGVHITRGKRWAWIWSLVSSIIGLVISAAAIVFGIIYIEVGWISLIIGIVLGGMYGTLLGLLCSKSARQWILMHRIQRGEVQVPGTPAAGGFAQAPEGPQRPETRPGSVTAAAVAFLLLAALGAWGVFNQLRPIPDMAAHDSAISGGRAMFGFLPASVHVISHTVVFVCAVIAAPLILRGKFGGRVFAIIAAVLAVLAYGILVGGTLIDQLDGYYDFAALPGRLNPIVPAYGWGIGRLALALLAFVLLLTPGMRAWTPPSAAALIVFVPQGPSQAQPPYGQPQQAPYGQQPPHQQGPQQPPPPYPGPQQPYSG